eukprot:10081289-Alexandrium_andersonii.AAC.1
MLRSPARSSRVRRSLPTGRARSPRPGPGRGRTMPRGLALGRPSPRGVACFRPVGSISGATSVGGAPRRSCRI